MSDIEVRHRLFWSFFILETEKWLGGMSSSGLHLCGLNFNGSFKFKREEPKDYRYCFTYNKFEASGGKNKKSGWDEVFRNEKWRVFRSPADDKSAMPNRRGLYLRNNSLLCLYALLSSLGLLLIFALTFGIFTCFSDKEYRGDEFYHGAIGIIGIFAVLLLINFVVFLRMTVANSRILEEPELAKAPQQAYHQFLMHKTFEDWLEKLLIRGGDIIKRFRPFWVLSPHSFEKWLASMEEKGYNVYKVHKTGLIFYFIKNAPKKLNYCIVNSEGEDISHFLNSGWKIVYSSSGFLFLGRIIILSKEFEEGALTVPFLSEREYIGNAARIMLRCISSIFVLLILSLTAFFALAFFKANEIGIYLAGAACIVFSILIIKMLIYFIKSVKIAKSIIYKQYKKL